MLVNLSTLYIINRLARIRMAQTFVVSPGEFEPSGFDCIYIHKEIYNFLNGINDKILIIITFMQDIIFLK